MITNIINFYWNLNIIVAVLFNFQIIKNNFVFLDKQEKITFSAQKITNISIFFSCYVLNILFLLLQKDNPIFFRMSKIDSFILFLEYN